MRISALKPILSTTQLLVLSATLELAQNCKARAHTGDCLNDPATRKLIAVAQENGWQRCYSCWRMVELEIGCNHIT